MVVVGVFGRTRGGVGVVGGGADVEDPCVSVYGAAGWVADPERVVSSEVIAFIVREGWCGWLGNG